MRFISYYIFYSSVVCCE